MRFLALLSLLVACDEIRGSARVGFNGGVWTRPEEYAVIEHTLAFAPTRPEDAYKHVEDLDLETEGEYHDVDTAESAQALYDALAEDGIHSRVWRRINFRPLRDDYGWDYDWALVTKCPWDVE